jgi:hypothetical protein
MLYTDWKRDHYLNREEAIQTYQRVMDENGGSTALYAANDYLWAYMDAYYDIPISDSGYTYTTDVVPFLQIVLAGYVPTYGPALNFSSNIQDDKLRLADFGVYPSYFVTYEVTAEMLNTQSNWIYTSSYGQWAAEIEGTYEWLNGLLGPVRGQEIVARELVGSDVVATTYENGKQIIVNYSTAPYTQGSVTVNPKDAVITEVTP